MNSEDDTFTRLKETPEKRFHRIVSDIIGPLVNDLPMTADDQIDMIRKIQEHYPDVAVLTSSTYISVKSLRLNTECVHTSLRIDNAPDEGF